MRRTLNTLLTRGLARSGLRRGALPVRAASGAHPPIPRLLLCFGAQKSGTTWLFDALTQHPGIHAGPCKEPQYFTHVHCRSQLAALRKARKLRRLLRTQQQAFVDYTCGLDGGADPFGFGELMAPLDDDWYLGLFASAGTAWAADFSPDYAQLPPEGIDHIKRLSQEQRVIFVMREPLARMQSAIRYHFQTRRQDITTASADDILRVARLRPIRDFTRYAATVSMLRAHFPPDRLHFMIFEQMVAAPQDSVDAVFDWLRLPRRRIAPDILSARANATPPHDLPPAVLEALERVAGPERQKALRLFPEAEPYWR